MRIVADSHVIAEHVRDWEAENVHYDPVHYLALLERKPNSASISASRFEQWNLPEVGSTSFDVVSNRNQAAIGRREFIKVLRLLEKSSAA